MTNNDVKRTAAFKTLEEMNLLDDFLFGSVVTYPEIGERFVKILLKTIFGREFKHLSVTAQKVLYGADRNLHGARLDVYLEPETGDETEGHAAVYDIEPDQKKCSSGFKGTAPQSTLLPWKDYGKESEFRRRL